MYPYFAIDCSELRKSAKFHENLKQNTENLVLHLTNIHKKISILRTNVDEGVKEEVFIPFSILANFGFVTFFENCWMYCFCFLIIFILLIYE